MALYKNISDRAQYICSNMNKILIQPDGIVEITTRDLQHSGGALRYFESLVKSEAVANEGMAKIIASRVEKKAV
jgi:hypothetical protein